MIHLLWHLLWIVPAALFLAGTLWFALPHAVRKVQVRSLQRMCSRRRVICLTYDDGPGEDLTEQLLELLAEHNARATFFLLGKRVETNPRPFKRLTDSNHEIGTHSQWHFNAWKASPLMVGLDIKRGWETIEGRLGQRLRFRPPYGKATLAGWAQVLIGKRKFGWWTHDSGDTGETLPSIDRVVDQLRRSGGGVVLLHDFDEDRSEERVRYVLDLTRAILTMARSESMTLLTMSELEANGA